MRQPQATGIHDYNSLIVFAVESGANHENMTKTSFLLEMLAEPALDASQGKLLKYEPRELNVSSTSSPPAPPPPPLYLPMAAAAEFLHV